MIKQLKGLYTMAGVAEMLGIHQASINRAIAGGTLRAYETECRKAKLLKLSDVKTWREKYPKGRPVGSKGKKKKERDGEA